MPCNKRFTNRVTRSVLKIRSPHCYVRLSHARAVRKRWGFVFLSTDRVTVKVNDYSKFESWLTRHMDPIGVSAPYASITPVRSILVSGFEYPCPLSRRHRHIIEYHSPGGYLQSLHTGCACHVLGYEIFLKSIFLGSKIYNMNFPILGGKKFQQLSFFLDSIL